VSDGKYLRCKHHACLPARNPTVSSLLYDGTTIAQERHFITFPYLQLTMSIPTTTKAIIFAKNGGPEVLEFTPNHPIPEVSPTEILVKVEYAGVNFFDSLLR
jgi:hypothetical protein